MLENTVDALIKKIKNTVITDPNMTEIPLGYLMTRDIPESVKHFFDQEVELWIREEEDKFVSSDRFDYDMPEVRMLIDQIFDFLKQNARFDLNKFNQLLERAVKLEMNYLIEPQRTLSQFIFKDNSVVATMDVYDTLKYFFRLEYYKDAISDYFNSKYLHEISQDQFQGLIAQIDEKVFKENTFEVTLKTIKAVTSFINESTEEDLDRIDLDILSHIFKDRALDKYTALVDQLKEKQREDITFAELETILQEESIASLESEPKEAELEVSEATQLHMEAIQDIEESKPEVEVENIEIGEMTAPEPEIEEEEEEEEEETQVTPAAPEPEPVKKPANVASEMADFVASQISTDQPLGDLHSVIQGRPRKKIIKKLFRKKENEYNSFIDLVNQHSTWKDASVIIDDEFYERGINPYSKEAIMFSDLIYLRFFPKDKYVGEQRD
jgi:hypothetical protein